MRDSFTTGSRRPGYNTKESLSGEEGGITWRMMRILQRRAAEWATLSTCFRRLLRNWADEECNLRLDAGKGESIAGNGGYFQC